MMYKARSILLLLCALFYLTGCQQNTVIVTAVEEREANEIIVFLASKGIAASKLAFTSSSPGGAQGGSKWNISVNANKSTDAMAILNQNGLPRIKGVNLLDLFGKPGMMSSEKEDTIRYQAGLSEQIASTIRRIDGVIDANVLISFPTNDGSGSALPWEPTTPQKITAAVYVKHQGILDDPNSHLIIKIKRLVSSSVNGLDINDVTVISDKARFADITLGQSPEMLSTIAQEDNYVSIWSIVMSKNSASRFRVVFFFLCFFMVIFALFTAWLVWKIYPTLKAKGGLKKLLQPTPFMAETPPTPAALEPESPPPPPQDTH
ncbi:MAG: type III secretion inner membrane ring lipoprotein SctJ [Chlamydiota bacterium]